MNISRPKNDTNDKVRKRVVAKVSAVKPPTLKCKKLWVACRVCGDKYVYAAMVVDWARTAEKFVKDGGHNEPPSRP